MCLRLIIAENRPELFSIWDETFSNIQEVIISDIDAWSLCRMPDLDAEIVMSMFAHERYGGDVRLGESQILSTGGEQGMPPWIITTPPFAAHTKKYQQSNQSLQVEIIQNEQVSYEEEAYVVFSKVFEKVKHFNNQNPNSQIKTIGFESRFLNFPRGDIRLEAEAIRNAYLDCRESHTLILLQE